MESLIKNVSSLEFVDILNQKSIMLTNLGLIEEHINNFKINKIVIVGMGGSILGAKMLYSLNDNTESWIKGISSIEFIDYINPDKINQFFNKHNSQSLQHTLFIFQSKSGNTIETKIIRDYTKSIYTDFKLSSDNNIIIVTDKNSNFDTDNGSNLKFFIPKNLGGRFSVLSYMGIITAYIAGVDISELLSGANKCVAEYISSKTEVVSDKNSATGLDQVAEKIVSNSQDIALLNYNHRYDMLNPWLQQLVCESLGKAGKEVLPIAFNGPRDQHSILQMLSQGDTNKMLFFLPPISESDLSVDNYTYTLKELASAQYQGVIQDLENKYFNFVELKPDLGVVEGIGYIIIYFELLTVALGTLMDINPFDQPGVEFSKTNTRNILNNLKNN